MYTKVKLSKSFAVLLFSFFIMMTIACSSSKSGCPVNDQAQVKTNKKGELPSSRGKSSLFPKDVKKKVGVK
ncbi:MAG: hypothetical protein JNK41_14445 [Saprospiraceae bacterium]|jgi:hypothetical protein|nr:hypothetical protein [Saprospiraceae bacterium]